MGVVLLAGLVMLLRSHNHEASQLSVFQGTILLEAFVLMMLFSTLEEEN